MLKEDHKLLELKEISIFNISALFKKVDKCIHSYCDVNGKMRGVQASR